MPRPDRLPFFDQIREEILRGAHQLNYKGGAITDKISESTPVLDAINMLLNCPTNNADEKKAFTELRMVYVNMKREGKKEPEDYLPDQKLRMAIMLLLLHCIEVFQGDAKAHSMYISPTTFQRLRPFGTVAQTYTIDNDDTKSVSEGGKIGIPPGAPELYAKAQAENMKQFSTDLKNAKGNHV